LILDRYKYVPVAAGFESKVTRFLVIENFVINYSNGNTADSSGRSV